MNAQRTGALDSSPNPTSGTVCFFSLDNADVVIDGISRQLARQGVVPIRQREPPGNEKGKSNSEPNTTRRRDTCIFPEQSRRQRTGRNARQKRKPTVRHRQRSLLQEEHKSAATSHDNPHPCRNPPESFSPYSGSTRLCFLVRIGFVAHQEAGSTALNAVVCVPIAGRWKPENQAALLGSFFRLTPFFPFLTFSAIE